MQGGFSLDDLMGGGQGGRPRRRAQQQEINGGAAGAGNRGGRRRRRPGPSLDDILDQAMEAEEAGTAKKKEKTYDYVGLPEEQDFYDTYGEPLPQSECPLCTYPTHVAKDHQSVGVESRDMRAIARIMRSGVTDCNWQNVAIQISEKWREMADRVNKRIITNHTNEKTIGYVDVATAYAHLESHVLAPELITNNMLRKVSSGWNQLWRGCIMEKDKETGKLSFSEQQMRNAQRLCTMAQSLMKNRPPDMMNFQKDVHTESSKTGQYLQVDSYKMIQLVKRRKVGY